MQAILEGFGLGFVGGFVPGSILTILLISVIQGGFSSGVRAFLISLFAEVTIVGALLLILFTLPIPEDVFTYIGLVGGLVLFYFGYQVLKIKTLETPGETKETFTFSKIYILAATNAPLYIFWVTVCAPLIWQMANEFSLVFSAVSFMTAFEIGWSMSTFAIMLVFVKMRRFLTNPRIMRKVYIGVSVFMFLLGSRMLYSAITTLVV